MRRRMLRDGAVVRSAIRGRERWDVGPLRSHPRYAAALERELSRHAPIRQVFANPLTGRLLLCYDPGVQRTEIHDRLHSALDVEPASAGELREWRTEWPRGFHRSPDDAAVAQARTRLILSGTLFAGVLAKRALFGAGMFAGSPAFVSASAVMTIIAGYTALRRGFDGITETVGIPGRTLLTVATLGLHVSAESLDGLGALVFAHVGELFEATATRKSRGAIRTIDAWWERDDAAATARVWKPQPLTALNTAALFASGGMVLFTGDPQRSLAMLLGGVPLATRESLTTALALSTHQAVDRNILFRDPGTLASRNASEVRIAVASRSSREVIEAADILLLDDDPATMDAAVDLIARTSRVVNENRWAARFIGAAGFTAAALGMISAATASKLHNYTRVAMELNSMRLVLPAS